jgi:multidrug efflux pump subunit AcrA (membrane-fusion protein)
MKINTKIKLKELIFVKKIQKKIVSFVDNNPLTSFFGLLAIIVIIIIAGNMLRKPSETVQKVKKPQKNVEIFSIGKAPKLTFSGKVEKSGVIKIVAQSPGVVQMINRTEGAQVSHGTILFRLSTNYSGGNIPSLSREIAQKNAILTEKNYPVQKEIIAKRRELAQTTDAAADDMRKITSDSIQNTKDLVTLNEEILESINNNLKTLEATNIGGANDAIIFQTKQAKAGVLSGLNGLKTALRNAEYSSAEGNAQARLSDLGRELALKQLDVEEKALDLGREIAQINLNIAQITESLMLPAAPCPGIIERIYVNIADTVTQGQRLASIVCQKNIANVIVSVSSDIAKQISRLENSTLLVGETRVNITPRYISQEPTDGNFHSVIFTLPEDAGKHVADGDSIPLEIPIGSARSTASVPYIPIDAVFQTQSSAIIYVASQSAEGKWVAISKEISPGQVFGSFVEVLKGLDSSDQIIINRNVIAGDEVRF